MRFGQRIAIGARFAIGAALATPIAASRTAAQEEVAYTGSVQFATGNYLFSTRTNSLYVSSGLTASIGPTHLAASIPVIAQSTPWISYAGGGGIPSGGPEGSSFHEGRMSGRMGRGGISLPDTTSFAEVGIGDPIFHADVELARERRSFPSIRFGGDVKLPIASPDRGFGTGEWDYAVGLSLSKAVRGTFLFADAAYWVLGDLPDVQLTNAVAYGFGVGRVLAGGRVGLLASLSGYTRIISDVDPPVQAALGMNYRFTDGHSVSASAGFGLTDAAADVSLSLGWRIPLW